MVGVESSRVTITMVEKTIAIELKDTRDYETKDIFKEFEEKDT